MKRREFLKASVGVAIAVGMAGKLGATSGSGYVLNETAMRVLELKRSGMSAEEIARALTEEYEVEYPEAYRDVLDFLAEVRRLGLA